MQQEVSEELQKAERIEARSSVLVWSGLVFAFLQSVCTGLIAASGLRFAIGLASLMTAVVTSTPAQDLHRDTIRLPMLIFALAGAGINFLVLWQVRRLRRRPAAQWRVRPLSAHKRRMERWQFALSVLTVLLVLAELIAHKRVHGFYLVWLHHAAVYPLLPG